MRTMISATVNGRTYYINEGGPRSEEKKCSAE